MVPVPWVPPHGVPVNPAGLLVGEFRPALPDLACEMWKWVEINSPRVAMIPPVAIAPGPCALPHTRPRAAEIPLGPGQLARGGDPLESPKIERHDPGLLVLMRGRGRRGRPPQRAAENFGCLADVVRSPPCFASFWKQGGFLLETILIFQNPL